MEIDPHRTIGSLLSDTVIETRVSCKDDQKQAVEMLAGKTERMFSRYLLVKAEKEEKEKRKAAEKERVKKWPWTVLDSVTW